MQARQIYLRLTHQSKRHGLEKWEKDLQSLQMRYDNLQENSKNTANDIQGISQLVISAVNKLMENAQDLMGFMQERVLDDYVGI